jgi:hypothetical protein
VPCERGRVRQRHPRDEDDADEIVAQIVGANPLRAGRVRSGFVTGRMDRAPGLASVLSFPREVVTASAGPEVSLE